MTSSLENCSDLFTFSIVAIQDLPKLTFKNNIPTKWNKTNNKTTGAHLEIFCDNEKVKFCKLGNGNEKRMR